MGEFTIPDTLNDKFFFVVAELKGADGKLVSRSVYWPRALKLMADPEFRQEYRATPQHSLVFEHGPWLHKQVEALPTSLALEVVSEMNTGENRSRVEVRVRNTGSRRCSFPTSTLKVPGGHSTVRTISSGCLPAKSAACGLRCSGGILTRAARQCGR